MASMMDFPSAKELLIRSASTLLSIICEPTFPPLQQNPLAVRLVDRTALLFVIEPEADASAVAVILTGKETIMMRVTEGLTQVNGDEISRMTGHDWLSECCRGHGPMGPAQHANQLEHLFHQLQDPTDKDSSNSFSRFVYFQCFPNISFRLSHPLSGLFHYDSIDTGLLHTRFVLTSGETILDPKIAKHGDGWIIDLWEASLEEPPVFELRNGIEHLVYDAESAVNLQNLICHLFGLLNDEMEVVARGRLVHMTPEMATDQYIWTLKRALYGMEYYMDFFSSLIKSPCWEKHSRQPTVIAWVLNHGNCPEAKSIDPIAAVNGWLQSIGEWAHALFQSTTPSRSTRILFSRAVKFKSLQVPPISQPRRQSTLTQLLQHVAAGATFTADDAARTLQALAATKPYYDQKWGRLTTHNWSGWSQGFTGSTHCAAELVSTLEDQQDPFGKRAKRLIGVDTPCCTICSIYIHGLNPSIAVGTPSGKICPWATPNDVSEEVELYMLKVLKEMVQKRLLELGTKDHNHPLEEEARVIGKGLVRIGGRYRLLKDGKA